MKALLIIDMQEGGFKPGAPPRFDAENVISKINRLAETIRKTGNKVIFIQHDGSKESAFIPGTPDWEIIASLRVEQNDLRVSKTANDPFYKSDLQGVLDGQNIKELIVTGWATDFCVDSAIRSALSRDFNVTVVKDGHTMGDRPHLSAEKVIEHHNWIWQDMIPTNGKVQVRAFADVMQELGSSLL